MLTFELLKLPRVILIGKRICDENWGYNSHVIQNYELIFVFKGVLNITLDGNVFSAKPGDCILLKHKQIFSAGADPLNPCKYYIVHFIIDEETEEISNTDAINQINDFVKDYNGMDNDDVFSLPQLDFKRVYLLAKYSLSTNKEDFFNILEKAIQEKSHLALSGETLISLYLSEILFMLSRLSFKSINKNIFLIEDHTAPKIVQEIIFYIHDNYMHQIELKNLIEVTGVSEQFLIRIFKKHTGKTPIQYINLYRIKESKKLLKYTSLSIKEICFEVGFENPYYFSRVFKKLEGKTPSQFRDY